MIALRADANAGIVRRPIDVALRPDISLEWTWRVNALPSRVREDAFATHDYASIALEFDDGRDLTWYWSAALPVGHHYRRPLPRWRESETHVGARSGPQRLGVTERRSDGCRKGPQSRSVENCGPLAHRCEPVSVWSRLRGCRSHRAR